MSLDTTAKGKKTHNVFYAVSHSGWKFLRIPTSILLRRQKIKEFLQIIKYHYLIMRKGR